MKYVIDIDGTICSITNGAYAEAVPFMDRIARINELFDVGHEILYWTARGGTTGIDWTELTKKQLSDWGVKYTKLKMFKPRYDVWVDDKAFNSEDFFK